MYPDVIAWYKKKTRKDHQYARLKDNEEEGGGKEISPQEEEAKLQRNLQSTTERIEALEMLMNIHGKENPLDFAKRDAEITKLRAKLAWLTKMIAETSGKVEAQAAAKKEVMTDEKPSLVKRLVTSTFAKVSNQA